MYMLVNFYFSIGTTDFSTSSPYFLRVPLILNNNLGGVSLIPKEDGLYATYKVGADAVLKKLGSAKLHLLASAINFGTVSGSGSSAIKEISVDISDYSMLIFYMQCGNVEIHDEYLTSRVGAVIIADKKYLKEHSTSYLMSNYYWSGGAAIEAYLKYNSEKSLSAYFKKNGATSTTLPIQYGYLFGV